MHPERMCCLKLLCNVQRNLVLILALHLCMLADDLLCKFVCGVEQSPAVAAQHLV